MFEKWELIKQTCQKIVFFFKAAVVSKSNKSEDATLLTIIFQGDFIGLELSFFSSILTTVFLLCLCNVYYNVIFFYVRKYTA